MGFALLLLLNAILFIRPMEFIPLLYALPLYEITLAACLIFGFPAILEQLSTRSLADRPITVCVLGLLIVIPTSNLTHGQFVKAFDSLDGFFKVVLYYLLMVGLIDTPERIRRFLDWMIVCIAVIVGVAVLNHYGYVHISNFEGAVEGEGDTALRRMGSTGLFGDPNDLGVLIAQGVILTIDRLLMRGGGLLRFATLGILALLFYGLNATSSRGGILALLAGLAVYCIVRFGRRGILVIGLGGPMLLAVFAGRQADFDISGGSGQARIHLWDTYLGLAMSHPVSGIGCNNWFEYDRQVAHNSFLFGFAELGAPGGILFAGAFYAAFQSLRRVHVHLTAHAPGLAKMSPCLIALLASLVLGMMSLTWTYLIPAYWTLALTTAYIHQAISRVRIGAPVRMRPMLIIEFAFVGLTFMAALFFFVKFKASYY